MFFQCKYLLFFEEFEIFEGKIVKTDANPKVLINR